MESSDSPREQEAAALRKWFSSQKRFGSWAAMERALDITRDYLHLIKSGKRRAVDRELRAKLYDATGLDIFEPIPKNLGRTEPVTILKEEHPERGVLLRKPKDSYEERATKVKKLLVMLADELEFFKEGSESARERFRRIIPGEDVGYITTLLRALYNEDQFQRWLLFSKYEMKSRESA